MIEENLSLRDSYLDVVAKRFVIAPNIGFWRQMIVYEEERHGETTVELNPGQRTPIPDVYLNKNRLIKERLEAFRK